MRRGAAASAVRPERAAAASAAATALALLACTAVAVLLTSCRRPGLASASASAASMAAARRTEAASVFRGPAFSYKYSVKDSWEDEETTEAAQGSVSDDGEPDGAAASASGRLSAFPLNLTALKKLRLKDPVYGDRLPGPPGEGKEETPLVRHDTYDERETLTVRAGCGLSSPYDVAVEAQSERLYVADTGNNRVVAVEKPHYSNRRQLPTRVVMENLHSPMGIAVDASGLVFVSDTKAHRIMGYDPDTDMTTLVAGGSGEGYMDGSANEARFSHPVGIDATVDGRIFVCDVGNLAVRMIHHGRVSTVVGGGSKGTADGAGSAAQFLSPFGLSAHLPSGDLYVTDTAANTIRKIYPCESLEEGYEVRTLVPPHTDGYRDEWARKNPKMSSPTGLAVDLLRRVYFSDTRNHAIRQLTNSLVTTVAGMCEDRALAYECYRGADAPAQYAIFHRPFGMARHAASGRLYIAEPELDNVRLVDREVPDETALLDQHTGKSYSASLKPLPGPWGEEAAAHQRLRGGGSGGPGIPRDGNGNPISPLDPRVTTEYVPTSQETETRMQVFEKYFWNQGFDVPEITAMEKDQMSWDFGCVHLYVPIPEQTKAKDVEVDCKSWYVQVVVAGIVLAGGHISGQVRPDEMEWEIMTKLDRRVVHVLLPKVKDGAWVHFFESERATAPNYAVTNRVWMEFEIDGEPAGKVVIGLFGNAKPKGVENFRALCTGEKGPGTVARQLWYKGCNVHLVMRDHVIGAGDIVDGSGMMGESIYGETFQDTIGYSDTHVKPWMVSLVSMPRNTDEPEIFGSQFCITMKKMQYLDRQQMIIGKVLHGHSVLQAVSNTGHKVESLPTVPVRISNCGEEQFAINYMEEDPKKIEKQHVDWLENYHKPRLYEDEE